MTNQSATRTGREGLARAACSSRVRISVGSLADQVRAVEFAGDGPFIRAASRNAVFIAAERVMVHGFGHLEFARARSTWLKAHLEAGTSLPALRAIAGPLSMNTLDALIGPISEALTPEAAAAEGLKA